MNKRYVCTITEAEMPGHFRMVVVDFKHSTIILDSITPKKSLQGAKEKLLTYYGDEILIVAKEQVVLPEPGES
jgi:hypothetical protein